MPLDGQDILRSLKAMSEYQAFISRVMVFCQPCFGHRFGMTAFTRMEGVEEPQGISEMSLE